MPAITATNMKAGAQAAVTKTTLDGSTDTLTFTTSRNPVLILDNVTGGALSPVIDGDGASANYSVEGVGDIDLTGGYAVGSIPAGDSVAIPLNKIKQYLQGTIDITGATGIEAALLEF